MLMTVLQLVKLALAQFLEALAEALIEVSRRKRSA